MLLSRIIKAINTQLETVSFRDERFSGALYSGIATRVPVTYSDGRLDTAALIEVDDSGQVVM
jgi:hypothetical protein